MSNKSSHTPGPYSVLEAVTGFQITAKAQTEQYQGQVVAIAEVRSWDGEPPINQVRANADLFAAAPELLEALKGLVDEIGRMDLGGPGVANAKLVIAKAEGSSRSEPDKHNKE